MNTPKLTPQRTGNVAVSGTALQQGDSIGLWDTSSIGLQTGARDTDLLIVETAM
jgi:hypothetical protein